MNSRMLTLLACSNLVIFAAIPAAHAQVAASEIGEIPVAVDSGTDVKIDDSAIDITPVLIAAGGVDEAPGVDPVKGIDPMDGINPRIYEGHIPLPEERIYTMAGVDNAEAAAESAAEQAADRVVERVQVSAAAQATVGPQ